MAAVLMTTVVASSSTTTFSALPDHGGYTGAAGLSSTSSSSSFGIEGFAGSSSSGGPSTRRGIRSMSVNYENCSSSYSGLRTTWMDSGRAGHATLSSKLTNDVDQSASPMVASSRRSKGIRSMKGTDVIEDTEYEKSIVSEANHEVLHSDSSRTLPVNSLQLDLGGSTKPMSLKDYLEHTRGFIKQTDRGPPRWFCPIEATGSPADAPVLLFLPGMDAIGLGLLLHQKKLARLFEVQVLHISISDRTNFEGLIEIVEKQIREEYDRKLSPIYVMGESFGGCLALSVAARNPDLDIVLIISNPATSFESNPLQPYIPLLQWVPDDIYRNVPYLLGFALGSPVRIISASVSSDLPPLQRLLKVAEAMRDLVPTLPVIADIMPRELLEWKVRLIKTGAEYANARLRYVKSDILLLASGNDLLLPSGDEARRLKNLLPQTKARYFPNSGHTLLLEDGVDVASLIKQTQMLRHRKHKKTDPVADFRYPSADEIATARRGFTKVVNLSPIFLSTSENGRVRTGLPELPKQRPVLFVSNHTLVGFDLGPVVDEFLEKKDILLRGLQHPLLFEEPEGVEESAPIEILKLFGAVPVSGKSLHRLLARGEAALLYPGGVREALKRKGEKYRLIWPESAEFVRTAIRHGATIVPFASVGGDDICEIPSGTDELLSLPVVNEYVGRYASQYAAARYILVSTKLDFANLLCAKDYIYFHGYHDSVEIGDFCHPCAPLSTLIESLAGTGRTTGTEKVMIENAMNRVGYLKPPPRFYYLFKQPISTEGMLHSINERAATDKLYKIVKTEIESGLEYLLQKRTEDPYKEFLPRFLYETANNRQAPTFNL